MAGPTRVLTTGVTTHRDSVLVLGPVCDRVLRVDVMRLCVREREGGREGGREREEDARYTPLLLPCSAVGAGGPSPAVCEIGLGAWRSVHIPQWEEA